MEVPITLEVEKNNKCYNCTECPSLIEILSINKETSIIKFKCINEDKNNIKEMPIKQYLSEMEKYNNEQINDDICPIHNINNKYTNYCLNCKEHLCNNCLLTKSHINHNKNNIIEIQPTDDDLNKMKEIIKNYQNKIDNLLKKKINMPKELNSKLLERKRSINNEMKKRKKKIKIDEENELKLYNDIFMLDIEEIKKNMKMK